MTAPPFFPFTPNPFSSLNNPISPWGQIPPAFFFPFRQLFALNILQGLSGNSSLGKSPPSPGWPFSAPTPLPFSFNKVVYLLKGRRTPPACFYEQLNHLPLPNSSLKNFLLPPPPESGLLPINLISSCGVFLRQRFGSFGMAPMQRSSSTPHLTHSAFLFYRFS